MFQMGVQIDIDMFMDRSDGKIPVNIIYMNTLNSSNDKQFFLSTLLRELYCWMLKNPSEEVQLLFYVDEIAPYIPPHPRNPPPKEAYSLLFKQARKYGIGLIAATQNVTDIDYKALAQVNTWCLGRLMTKQDVARVQKIIQSIDPMRADKVLQKLPSLRTGEFMMLSPDFYDDVVNFQVRWLVTDHQTLDEKDLSEILSSESRQFFEKYMMQKREKAVPSPSFIPRKAIDEQVQLFLDSARQVVSIDAIAQKSKLNTEDVERVLRKLVKTKVVKRGRVSDNREYVYWLSKFGFNPSKNIVGEVITIPARISQIEATKRSKSMLEGGFWGKKEEIYDVEFSQLPIWRITATRKFRKLLFTKEKTGTYYLSAQTGALVSLEKKRIVFKKVVTKGEKLKGLHDGKDMAFISKLPSEVENFPKIKMGIKRIYRKLIRTLGVEPVSAGMILLPVWTSKVRHKKTLAKRAISIDAATGRILTGHF